MTQDTESVRMLEGGRVVIPARFRKALGFEPGEILLMELKDGEVRLTTRLAAIRRAQELVAPYLRNAGSLADELIAERRLEAQTELDD